MIRILIRRILGMWYSIMIESAIVAWFFRTTMKGWIERRPFYMKIGGISTICRRRRWSRVCIWLMLLKITRIR